MKIPSCFHPSAGTTWLAALCTAFLLTGGRLRAQQPPLPTVMPLTTQVEGETNHIKTYVTLQPNRSWRIERSLSVDSAWFTFDAGNWFQPVPGTHITTLHSVPIPPPSQSASGGAQVFL